jgi:glycosyltransferase involved in cell wall biosynthesis
MNRSRPMLAIVVPCYNEETQIPITIRTLLDLLKNLKTSQLIADESWVVFVDDGSSDNTWEIIQQYAKENTSVKGIKLACNAGHQAALMAGLMESREASDCTLSIDADLQHDISVIPEMLRLFSQGSDIITGVRLNRAGDTRLKKFLSNSYYWVMQKMGTPILPQHADFRLLGKNVLNALANFPERNLFLRGVIASMGFNSETVSYVQQERNFGESKYTLFKMLSLAWNGITSFSAFPLRISVFLSIFTMILAILMAISTFIDWLDGDTVIGWSSIMLTMLFLGSIQLFCIAVLGEYIAKIYAEVKRRPHYIIEKKA